MNKHNQFPINENQIENIFSSQFSILIVVNTQQICTKYWGFFFVLLDVNRPPLHPYDDFDWEMLSWECSFFNLSILFGLSNFRHLTHVYVMYNVQCAVCSSVICWNRPIGKFAWIELLSMLKSVSEFWISILFKMVRKSKGLHLHSVMHLWIIWFSVLYQYIHIQFMRYYLTNIQLTWLNAVGILTNKYFVVS